MQKCSNRDTKGRNTREDTIERNPKGDTKKKNFEKFVMKLQ